MPPFTSSELVTLLVVVAAVFGLVAFGHQKLWAVLLALGIGFYLATTIIGAQVMYLVDMARTAIGH